MGRFSSQPLQRLPTLVCMPSSDSRLGRHLTQFDVVGLGINGVIGSGIFFVVGGIVGLLGPASLLATLLAGLLSLLVALCFAEVGSRFDATGGPYVYARHCFGEFVGRPQRPRIHAPRANRVITSRRKAAPLIPV